MKIRETPQGKYELYPYDVGNPEPKGLETSAFVLDLSQLYTLKGAIAVFLEERVERVEGSKYII